MNVCSGPPKRHRIAAIPWIKHMLGHGSVPSAALEAHLEGMGTEDSPYIVDWLPDDPESPLAYPPFKKWALTVVVSIEALSVAFVSSAYSGGSKSMMVDFGVSQDVVILGLSLFVLGLAIGPLLWGPMSELYGRQNIFAVTFGLLTIFNAAAAGSRNIQSVIVFRFLAGSFGSSYQTNAGGVIADIFPASERAPFLGPVLGPIVSGFVGQELGWRWVHGVMATFTGVVWLVGMLAVPETYAPVLLRRRAALISKITGKLHRSRIEATQGKIEPKRSFKIALSRPWVMLLREPIVLLLSLYVAILYGILYMLFPAFPIVYQRTRGWPDGIGGLAFIGLAVGMMGSIIYSIWDNKRYGKVVESSPTGRAEPEARLPPGRVGAVAIPLGLFWFAWTNGPDIHWLASIAAGVPLGFGVVLVILSVINYLVDSYTIFAASVLAANAVLRSVFGAAFPLFTTHMYRSLGIHWASSVPAFLALACIPFPFLFYVYGSSIRARCKYATEAAAVLEKLERRPAMATDEIA